MYDKPCDVPDYQYRTYTIMWITVVDVQQRTDRQRDTLGQRHVSPQAHRPCPQRLRNPAYSAATSEPNSLDRCLSNVLYRWPTAGTQHAPLAANTASPAPQGQYRPIYPSNCRLYPETAPAALYLGPGGAHQNQIHSGALTVPRR
eukprot:COSAG02_NODE_8612_length_2505_cov_22.815046_2_plen_145_part_00